MTRYKHTQVFVLFFFMTGTLLLLWWRCEVAVNQVVIVYHLQRVVNEALGEQDLSQSSLHQSSSLHTEGKIKAPLHLPDLLKQCNPVLIPSIITSVSAAGCFPSGRF